MDRQLRRVPGAVVQQTYEGGLKQKVQLWYREILGKIQLSRMRQPGSLETLVIRVGQRLL